MPTSNIIATRDGARESLPQSHWREASYTFKRNDSRVLDAALLERQLREASFVGEMPDLSKRTPR